MLTTVQGQLWQIISGSRYCQIVDGGRCVTDGVGNYGDNEDCEVEALQTLIMTTEQYSIEIDYDFITVKGYQYKWRGPNTVRMQAGDKWTWESDSDIQRAGFKICGR